MSPKLQEALDRAFPISQMGGLSGAMYPAGEGEGQGWAINNEDWEVVSGVVRELIDDPVAVVRRGVESGTIKLDYEAAAREAYNEGDPFDWWERLSDRGKEIRVDAMRPIVDTALGVGPVSDGGSET